MRCESGKPSDTPSPSSEAKAKPYLAAARRSGQRAGRGSRVPQGPSTLPPAPDCRENNLSPCRAEQLGLGMWARSGPGLRRGERGCMGGVPGTQISLRAPRRRRNQTGALAAKKGCARLLLLSPPPSSPSPSPLF